MPDPASYVLDTNIVLALLPAVPEPKPQGPIRYPA